MKAEGAVALVTGGGGLLGSATARRLVEQGMQVVVADLSPGRVADDSRITYVRCDATQVDDVRQAVQSAAQLGPLRLVVACTGAGIVRRTLSRDGTLHDLASFREMLEVNLVSAFLALTHAAAAMSELEPLEDGERGVIVLVSSLAGLEGSAGQLAYGAAKAGVAGMTLPAARDLAPVGIRVVTIAPGGMGEPADVDLDDSRIAGLLAGVVHPKRFGRAEDFALMVAQIVEQPYLNGSVVRLDGGARLGLKH
jgi:NAD(P)-dependent dehydrogenase (short-subunit alcohol dehydrogenase family)